MSPEYAMDGLFSIKSDVFSFGVLVLEIVSGTKNRGFYQTNNQLNLLAYVSIYIYHQLDPKYNRAKCSAIINKIKLNRHGNYTEKEEH